MINLPPCAQSLGLALLCCGIAGFDRPADDKLRHARSGSAGWSGPTCWVQECVALFSTLSE